MLIDSSEDEITVFGVICVALLASIIGAVILWLRFFFKKADARLEERAKQQLDNKMNSDSTREKH